MASAATLVEQLLAAFRSLRTSSDGQGRAYQQACEHHESSANNVRLSSQVTPLLWNFRPLACRGKRGINHCKTVRLHHRLPASEPHHAAKLNSRDLHGTRRLGSTLS